MFHTDIHKIWCYIAKSGRDAEKPLKFMLPQRLKVTEAWMTIYSITFFSCWNDFLVGSSPSCEFHSLAFCKLVLRVAQLTTYHFEYMKWILESVCCDNLLSIKLYFLIGTQCGNKWVPQNLFTVWHVENATFLCVTLIDVNLSCALFFFIGM